MCSSREGLLAECRDVMVFRIPAACLEGFEAHVR